MKILVLNGPNLNLLGIREPELYGNATYKDLVASVKAHAKARGVRVTCIQSNHEGTLVYRIQQALGRVDGIVLNAGGYTHTSVAIRDALTAVRIPTVEVHITDPDAREDFRKVNLVRDVCVATVKGKGLDGYAEAMDLLIESVKKQ